MTAPLHSSLLHTSKPPPQDAERPPKSWIWWLWSAELASRMGESVFQIALLWYLLELTGSSSVTGLATMIAYLPAFLVGLGAGVIVDRLPYRRVMLSANACRFALVLLIPFAWRWNAESAVLITFLGFLFSSASAFFHPARDAFIARVANPQRLFQANSLVQSAWQFSLAIAPFAAAFALSWVSVPQLFFGVALAVLLSSRALLPLSSADRSTGSPEQFWAEMHKGWIYLRGEPRILWVWLMTVLNNFFIMGPAYVGVPVFVREHLGGTAADFARVEGAYAVGMIVATWLFAKFGGRMEPIWLLIGGLLYDGLSFVLLLWSESVNEMILVIVIHSLGIPAITISRITIVHRIVPKPLQGRVFSYFHLAVAGMTALSIGWTGWIASVLPVPWVFALGGTLGACGVLGGLCIPALRSMLRHPAT